jgi:acyl-CoA thioesterase-1
MIAPPNMGPDYAEAFNPIYARLAAKHDAILYPFFLEGVAADDALNLPDGMHPNAEGVAMIVKNIMPKVEALLARISE